MSSQNRHLSGSRRLALVAVFSAVAMVLRLTVEVPFPLASYLKLEVWEIPVYIALLAYGGRVALGVSLTTYMIVQMFAAGSLPTGPIYNLIAILSTIGGLLIVKQLIRGRAELRSVSLAVLLITAGAVSRTVTMTFVNALALPQPFPIGFSIPTDALLPILEVTAAFNLIVAGYSVAFSLPIARRITTSHNHKEKRIPLQ